MQVAFEKCPRCGAHLEPYGPCPICGLPRDEMPYYDNAFLENLVKEVLIEFLGNGSKMAQMTVSKVFWLLLKSRGIKLEKGKYGKKVSWILNRIANEWGWRVEKKIRGTKKVYMATLPPSLLKDRSSS